jgi:hypothetical protein
MTESRTVLAVIIFLGLTALLALGGDRAVVGPVRDGYSHSELLWSGLRSPLYPRG